jgi:hypothetical protein
MSSIAGDLLEVAFSNDNVGSGTLQIKSNETVSFDPGGLRNEVSTTGSGDMIRKMNTAPWKAEFMVAWDNNDREDMEKLLSLSEDLGATTWTLSHISGVDYVGAGVIVGDINGDMNEGTIPITISGGGKMAK